MCWHLSFFSLPNLKRHLHRVRLHNFLTRSTCDFRHGSHKKNKYPRIKLSNGSGIFRNARASVFHCLCIWMRGICAVHDLRGKSPPACLTLLWRRSPTSPCCSVRRSCPSKSIVYQQDKIVCREGCTSRGSSALELRIYFHCHLRRPTTRKFFPYSI